MSSEAPSRSHDHDPRDRYAGRITVDVDGYVSNFELVALRAYYGLCRMADEVEVHISSSGEGIHLIGWLTEAMDFPTRLKCRRTLGDDEKRIDFDLERFMNGIYTGVLWSEKRTLHSPENAPEQRPGKDRSFSDIHDALSHMRHTTTDDYDRLKRLAEHGHRGAPELARYAGGWDT